MTREILFRGKRTDNDEGEFVYGIPVEGEPLLGMGKRTYIITKPGVQWVDGVYMTNCAGQHHRRSGERVEQEG